MDIKDLIKEISQQPGFKEDMAKWLKTGKANTGSVMYDIKSIIDNNFRQHKIEVLFSEADTGPYGVEADMAVEYRGETYDIAIRRRQKKEEA